MGKRKGAHGSGTWSVPGGHQEFGESPAQTAAREAKEETGVHIKNIRFGAITNDFFRRDGKHYLTVWMLSEYKSGTPHITEPNKYIDLDWRDFASLPKPLFFPWKQLLASPFIAHIKKNSGK